MNKITFDRADPYAKWRKLLAGELNPDEMHESEPLPGFYRSRSKNKETNEYGPWLPVAIWLDDKYQPLAIRNGGSVPLEWVWPYCVHNPVTEEVYRAVAEKGELWPDLHPVVESLIGHNAPPKEDSFEALADTVKELAREAEKLIKAGEAKSQIASDQAAHLTNALASLQKKVDAKWTEEEKPHTDAVKVLKDKWGPISTAAEIFKDLKAKVITPWLLKVKAEKDAKKAEADRIAAEAVKNGQEVPQEVREIRKTGTGTGKGGGKTIALRTRKKVHVTDEAALLDWLKGGELLRNFLQDAAEKSVRAGVTPPGVEVKEEQVAA